MKTAKHFLLLILAINFQVAHAGLQLVGDGTNENDNTSYCSKVQSVTQDSVDPLALAWQVNSDNITTRSTKLLSSSTACCVTLNTPKGPFKNFVTQYYANEKGKIIGRMNNRGYKVGEYQQMCDL